MVAEIPNKNKNPVVRSISILLCGPVCRHLTRERGFCFSTRVDLSEMDDLDALVLIVFDRFVSEVRLGHSLPGKDQSITILLFAALWILTHQYSQQTTADYVF